MNLTDSDNAKYYNNTEQLVMVVIGSLSILWTLCTKQYDYDR